MKLIDDDDKEISEINMTPFVDIVLVILIIFMATATFIVEQKIPLNLPEAKTGENKETENHQIVISITKKGLLLDNKPVKLGNLKNLLREKINSKNPTVLLRADRDVKFQRVVDVIDICRELGLEKYIIETQGKY